VRRRGCGKPVSVAHRSIVPTPFGRAVWDGWCGVVGCGTTGGRIPATAEAAMARGDHILAIDHGTQSVRALLFDPRGTLVHKARVEVEPYTSPRPGWAEQDPAYWRSSASVPGCGRRPPGGAVAEVA
jgi:hypothetical protein